LKIIRSIIAFILQFVLILAGHCGEIIFTITTELSLQMQMPRRSSSFQLVIGSLREPTLPAP
jgi:hypothetical protein